MRLHYVDYTKGLAIILMLFGHTMAKVNNVYTWIYSFHMPVFFIICGFLMFKKECQTEQAKAAIKGVVRRRLYTAGIPYYIFGIILAIFYTFLNIVANEPLSFGNKVFKLLTFQGIDSLWFLPVYVFADIIMMNIGNWNIAGGKGRLAVAVLSFITVSLLGRYMIVWYFDIIYKILLGICFIEIGILISKFAIIDKIPIWGNCILMIIGYYLAQVNGPVEMAASNIGNPAIYFLCAAAISVAIISLFKNVEGKQIKILNVVEIYGRNSIVLLCTNNLLIEVIRLIDYKITGNILISLRMTGCIIFTVILMVIEWEIIKLANGIFAPVFGRIKRVKE